MQNHTVIVGLRYVCKFSLHYSTLRGGVCEPSPPLEPGPIPWITCSQQNTAAVRPAKGLPPGSVSLLLTGKPTTRKTPDLPDTHHILERSPVGASFNCRPHEWASCPCSPARFLECQKHLGEYHLHPWARPALSRPFWIPHSQNWEQNKTFSLSHCWQW